MKIAILTSGGDSAGMNAVVRAVVKAGILKYAHNKTCRAVLYLTYTQEAVKRGSYGRATKAS